MIVKIIDSDPSHANRVFDSKGNEYSYPLNISIPELPFKARVDLNTKRITSILELVSVGVISTFIKELNYEELVVI